MIAKNKYQVQKKKCSEKKNPKPFKLESNPQPSRYWQDALTTELWAADSYGKQVIDRLFC